MKEFVGNRHLLNTPQRQTNLALTSMSTRRCLKIEVSNSRRHITGKIEAPLKNKSFSNQLRNTGVNLIGSYSYQIPPIKRDANKRNLPDRSFHNFGASTHDVPEPHKVRRSPDVEDLKR